MSNSVLIVERDAAFMYAMERTFRGSEFNPVSTSVAAMAIEHLQNTSFAAMILHPTLEGCEGILDALRGMSAVSRPMVIAVSGGGREVIERLDPTIVDLFMSKPVELQDLLKVVRKGH